MFNSTKEKNALMHILGNNYPQNEEENSDED